MRLTQMLRVLKENLLLIILIFFTLSTFFVGSYDLFLLTTKYTEQASSKNDSFINLILKLYINETKNKLLSDEPKLRFIRV